jgi:hypothetical protein
MSDGTTTDFGRNDDKCRMEQGWTSNGTATDVKQNGKTKRITIATDYTSDDIAK